MYATTTYWSFEEWTDEYQKILEENIYQYLKVLGL